MKLAQVIVLVGLVATATYAARPKDTGDQYLVGAGRYDITGPAAESAYRW
jgi:hypothetical protein